jgi:hypothetical protein
MEKAGTELAALQRPRDILEDGFAVARLQRGRFN